MTDGGAAPNRPVAASPGVFLPKRDGGQDFGGALL